MSISFVLMLIVTFLATLLGPICGIGGGVIIKPVVDALGIMPVAEVSFLSGIAVLVMAVVTLVQDALAGERGGGEHLPIALGAAAGGVAGKFVFAQLMQVFPHADRIGGVQALLLTGCALVVLVYMARRGRIGSLELSGPAPQLIVGLLAGSCWSFLGIGGGPFNVALLVFFFAMESKPAARASLLIIACSQTASIIFAFVAGAVPATSPEDLIGMASMAVAGSFVGRRLQRRFDSRAVDRLYIASLALIIMLCLYNAVRFLQM